MVEADPRTFDLFAPEESVIYPTETVKVYRNRSALYELKKLEDAINDSLDPDAVAKLEGKVAEVRAVIERSALHVTLKGISTIASDAVFESVPKVNPEGKTEAEVAELEEARDEVINMKILEAMLVAISNAEGATAGLPGERTGEWFETLPIEGRAAIMKTVRELSFAAFQYQSEVESADFSQTY